MSTAFILPVVSLTLTIYAILYLQIAVHELSHVLTALLLKVEISEIAIGSGPGIQFGRCKLSLLPTGGYVAVDTEQLTSCGHVPVMVFFESGSVTVLAVCFCLDICIGSILTTAALFTAVVFLIANNCFWIPKTDAGRMLHVFSGITYRTPNR